MSRYPHRALKARAALIERACRMNVTEVQRAALLAVLIERLPEATDGRDRIAALVWARVDREALKAAAGTGVAAHDVRDDAVAWARAAEALVTVRRRHARDARVTLAGVAALVLAGAIGVAGAWALDRELAAGARCGSDLDCACYARARCEADGPWSPYCEAPDLPDAAVALAREGACERLGWPHGEGWR